MKLSVIGLGKLGSPLAAVLAYKGYDVQGVDINADFVNAINAGRSPVNEPGLDDLIQRSAGRLSASTDYEPAMLNTDLTFVIVPTPSEPEGGFSLKHIMVSLESIGKVIKHKSQFHLVVITSTVMPGAMLNEILPALERYSGKTCGRDFGLCYNPEFIALGSVIANMLRPDFILIGESDSRSGKLLSQIYEVVCENAPPIARMNFVNAELTKLSVNTFVTTKISYANMLADICERLPGADVDTVTSAIGLDTRIGTKYLKGALGYSGPCFPRDNIAFAHLARSIGAQPLIAEATDNLNRMQASRLAKLIMSRLPPNGTVAILGASYKPNTDVIEESQSIKLAVQLNSEGIRVVIYDPVALNNVRRVLNHGVIFADTLEQCLNQVDVVVIATAWDEFKQLSPALFETMDRRPVIIDCWRILSPDKFESVADYVTLGVGP